MEGIQYGDIPDEPTSSAQPNHRLFPPDASIILVGCHGAGKKTLGFIAAKYLGRRLLTEDHFFEQSTGCNRATFLQKYGRETFNSQMALVLSQVLDSNRRNCVIECATGTLSHETRSVLSTYVETNPIIYVHRDKEDLYKLLKLPVADAERLLIADQRHRDFSNLEYFNLLDTSGDGQPTEDTPFRSASTSSARLVHAKQDFKNFLDNLSGHGLTRSWVENPFSIKAIPPEYRIHTFVLHLRLSVLMSLDTDLAHFEASAEAVELIIDTWPSNMLDFIAAQVALIRRKLDVPIIYHVEENPREERRRSPEEKDVMDLELMVHGLRLGVDYLSLDLERSEGLVSQVLAMRGRTKIIGNYMIRGFGAPPWTDDIYIQRYLRGQSLGCHIVRIARFCLPERADELRQVLINKINVLPDPKPHLIAYDFSVFGAVSPFQGTSLNPVYHDSLEKSSRELLSGVHTMRGTLRNYFRNGTLQPLNFYSLGSNVYYSASPSMHRAAYEHYMMPHTFDAKRCTSIEEVDRILAEPNFGGASLPAPFKVAIMSRLNLLSSHATAIGAANTVLPLRGEATSILDHANSRNKTGSTNKFYGDNTDWSSIVTCLRRAISPRNSVQPSRTTALVIGAGGMARAAIYALIKLGCRFIFIHNRTASKAEEVAQHFNTYAKQHRLIGRRSVQDRVCRVIESASELWPEGYQQPTIILSCIPASGTDDNPPVDFRMPPLWLRSPTGGVVVEVRRTLPESYFYTRANLNIVACI
ncbi:type I 3-dehydroquinase-domain-containing protein [Biscogniauxia marginata]|nr:type I 3-dehydroquinase-domain-containing protein [Biscogniauxia marginata]